MTDTKWCNVAWMKCDTMESHPCCDVHNHETNMMNVVSVMQTDKNIEVHQMICATSKIFAS